MGLSDHVWTIIRALVDRDSALAWSIILDFQRRIESNQECLFLVRKHVTLGLSNWPGGRAPGTPASVAKRQPLWSRSSDCQTLWWNMPD